MSKFKRKRVDFAVFISVLEIETFNDENLKQIRSISSKLRPVWRPQIFLQAKRHIPPPSWSQMTNSARNARGKEI